MLNAFRHHGKGDDETLTALKEARQVLNAFRHHGKGDQQFPEVRP